MWREFNMANQLMITLDAETTEKYLKLASERTEAELNADCEPSGASIQIEMGLWGDTVYFVNGSELIELGEAAVKVVTVNNALPTSV
jgi:hypothetical protein